MKYRVWMVILSLTLAISILCTSCPSPSPGTIHKSIMVANVQRTYLLHLPPAFDGSTKLPVVMALHPFSGTGQGMEKLTGFSVLADSENFIVVYPDGNQWVWNANPASPSSIWGPPTDDVAFLETLIDRLIEKYSADPDRVYITGASSGGLMTHRAACELTGKLAAAASVMITLPVGWQDYEHPSKPLPFLIVQGVADPFFPWEGGVVNEGPLRQSYYQSAADTVNFWVNNNGALSPPEEVNLPDSDPNDGATVFRRKYAASEGGAEVVLYGINGGGHTWPGSSDTSLTFLVGATCRDINATQVVWDFLKTHTRNH